LVTAQNPLGKYFLRVGSPTLRGPQDRDSRACFHCPWSCGRRRRSAADGAHTADTAAGTTVANVIQQSQRLGCIATETPHAHEKYTIPDCFTRRRHFSQMSTINSTRALATAGGHDLSKQGLSFAAQTSVSRSRMTMGPPLLAQHGLLALSAGIDSARVRPGQRASYVAAISGLQVLPELVIAWSRLFSLSAHTRSLRRTVSRLRTACASGVALPLMDWGRHQSWIRLCGVASELDGRQ